MSKCRSTTELDEYLRARPGDAKTNILEWRKVYTIVYCVSASDGDGARLQLAIPATVRRWSLSSCLVLLSAGDHDAASINERSSMELAVFRRPR